MTGFCKASLSHLIEALMIFRKYGDPTHPTICEHDVLIICGIEPGLVSAADRVRLNELGFIVTVECGEEQFQSFRYGSA